jgi:putative membrane protein
MSFNWGAFVNSLVYTVIGVLIFWLAFIIVDKITPYNLWKELVEEKNVALAIVVGAMCLAIAIIVAAAIHGVP